MESRSQSARFVNSIPLATRYIGNQSVTKNQTGSVSALARIAPQVCGKLNSSRQPSGFPSILLDGDSCLSARIMAFSAPLMRG